MTEREELEGLIDAELLSILACPLCADRPNLDLHGHYLLCGQCHNAFPIVDGIPQLTPEDGVPISKIKDQLDD